LAVYEVQAPQIAASKADGLRARYGVGHNATRFWDVHADMDELHGDWLVEAIAAVTYDGDQVARVAAVAADAWWAFLDEREAEARPLVPA
jgi:pyrroloquinoline quinone (PQQ) biosynthesis protein C